MKYINQNIKGTKRVFPKQGRYGKGRYDMNENPEGLPKDFVDSVLKEITPEFLAIYPEPDRFLTKYAQFLGVEQKNVLCTNGSDMAIRYILETFGEVGKDVVTVAPSFEMYWVNCSILGYRHIPVAYNDDLTIDVQNIINAITQDTRVVVMLNPNNPIGNVYSEDEICKVIDKAEKVGAIVIIDEAYHYFYEKTFLSLAIERPNVVLMRTFSKLMSLAACRLGVVISSPENIQYITNAKLTFDVNSIALLFGERLVERPDIIQNLIKIEKEGKKFLLDELTKRDYWCKDCLGNFMLIQPHREAARVVIELEKNHNVLVHAYSNKLLKEYIRVSIGSRKAMERFLVAFLDVEGSVK